MCRLGKQGSNVSFEHQWNSIHINHFYSLYNNKEVRLVNLGVRSSLKTSSSNGTNIILFINYYIIYQGI